MSDIGTSNLGRVRLTLFWDENKQNNLKIFGDGVPGKLCGGPYHSKLVRTGDQ